jgi:type II secretory pathway component PulF
MPEGTIKMDAGSPSQRNARPSVRPLMWMMAVHAILLAVLFGGLMFVVPRTVRLMEDFDVELPAMSVLVINISNFIVSYWLLLIPLAILILLADGIVYVAFSKPPGSGRVLALAWAIGWSLAAAGAIGILMIAMFLPFVGTMEKLN